MRPATAIGCSVSGVRPEVDIRVTVDHGWVIWPGRWEAPPSALRGAVCAAIPEAHTDLHGHGPDGRRQARATVYYRVRDGQAGVYAYGPRAREHLLEVARVPALRLPSGEPVSLGDALLEVTSTQVGVDAKGWHRYEFVQPYFPSEVAYARRPRSPGPERLAWAGQALASSVRMFLGDLGLAPDPGRPVHVHVHAYQQEQVQWRDRQDAVRSGFAARFVSNAILPDGIALGQHGSEGFGQVRRCE